LLLFLMDRMKGMTLARMKNKKTIALFLLLLLIPIASLLFSTRGKEAVHSPAPNQAPMPAARPAEAFSTKASHEELLGLFQSDEQPLDDRGRPLYKSGELLVRFKEGVSDAERQVLHQSLGSTVVGRMTRQRIEKVKVREGLPEAEALRLYGASPFVDHVERHALRYPLKMPNDPLFIEQWGLAKIAAPAAWNFTQCEPGILIAVIDTGVDYHHPDLLQNIWLNPAELNGLSGLDDDGNGLIDDIYGWDFANEDSFPLDVDGHGTKVAGVIASLGDNGLGIAGVCWNATVMALKVQADGAIEMESLAVIRALHYAMDHEARIVNCSFGGKASSPLEYDTFGELKDAGIIAVCAAGNSGVDSDVPANQVFPASYDHDNIIAVGASAQDDTLASFSNFGLKSVDLLAPGVLVKSTFPASTLRESRVVVHTDSGSTSYTAKAMLYAGVTGEDGITAVLFDCGLGYPEDFPAEVSGQVALIQRGEIYFSVKAANAKAAGALAAIIYNNRVDGIDDEGKEDYFDRDGGTLGAPGDWIPVVAVTKAEGEAILALGVTPVTVVNKPASSAAAYGSGSGTSFAAPHVSGMAGLILSKSPHLDHVGLKEAIVNTVDKVPALEGKIASGGRVNAFTALCSTNTLPADLSFDHALGLEDAVIAFQIASGLGPQTPICPVSIAPALDINGDGRIGLEEVIYILQHVGGVGRERE
jgi:subtilisin family serine protease